MRSRGREPRQCAGRTRRTACAMLLALPLPAAGPAALAAQENRGGANLGFDPSGYTQFNTTYSGNFTFVRLMYRTEPWRAYRNPGWVHDYPVAERNFAKILSSLTTMAPWMGGSNVMAMDDPEIFKYPVLYLSEPGYWQLSPAEADNLRTYLLKGGFLIIDDMAGPREWANTVRMIEVLMPENQLVELHATDPVFDSFFHLEEDAIHMPHPYGRGIASYWGIHEDDDPDGRLMLIVDRDNDIGDYMEWSDRGFLPISLSNEAYKIAVNYVIYAYTH